MRLFNRFSIEERVINFSEGFQAYNKNGDPINSVEDIKDVAAAPKSRCIDNIKK